MSLQYKIDVLAALKAKGWTSYRLRKEKILGERVIQQLRDGVPVSWEVLSRLCDLLACDIGDILTIAPDAGEIPTGESKAMGMGLVTSANNFEPGKASPKLREREKRPVSEVPKSTVYSADGEPKRLSRKDFTKKMLDVVAVMETTDKPYGLDDAICELNGAEDVFFTQIRFILQECKDVIAADERGREQIAGFIQSVHGNLDAIIADTLRET